MAKASFCVARILLLRFSLPTTPRFALLSLSFLFIREHRRKSVCLFVVPRAEIDTFLRGYKRDIASRTTLNAYPSFVLTKDFLSPSFSFLFFLVFIMLNKFDPVHLLVLLAEVLFRAQDEDYIFWDL